MKRNAVELILKLAKKDNMPGLSTLPGTWRRKLDARWEIWVNGHPRTMKGGTDSDIDVEPYDCYVEYNGWPAGAFSIVRGEGVLASGAAANYDTFCDALEVALAFETEARP